MDEVMLGRTGLRVNKNGFGALPIQRVSTREAVALLHRALEGGINYYDTARAYSDSEEKLGIAFAGRWDRVVLSTKTMAKTAADLWTDLEASLKALGTDCIDLYQFHTPPFCPKPGDPSGLYDAALEAKRQGKIRFIGITNHRVGVAREAIASGLYDTIQYPFSYLTDGPDLEIVTLSRAAGMGFIAMKGLAGGLITNSALAYAFMAQYDHVAPIWGIQRLEELEEFLSYQAAPLAITEARQALIDQDRRDLAGAFCRGCGYCMPCPAGIEISNAARMSLLLRRAPKEGFLTPQWRENMKKIEDCTGCGACKSKCPYGLDTPALLKRNYEDYQHFL